MITFTANGRCASCVSDGPITSGSIGIPVLFNLSADFDDLVSVAVFSGNGVTIDVVLFDTSCVVPPEVLAEPGGALRIGVYARNGDGTIAIPTIWADAGLIRLGTLPSGIDPAEPTPDWMAQVQEAAQNAVDAAREANENSKAAVEHSDAALKKAGETLNRAEEALDKADDSMLLAKGYAEDAEKSSESAAHYADLAQQGADKAGYAWFDVNDEDGGMYVTVTPDLNESVSFAVEESTGLLEVVFHG